MSISSITAIMERISVATPESRIAVFLTPAGLDSICADTIGGRERIWRDYLALLGIWDRTSNKHEILAKLEPYKPAGRVKRGPKVGRGRVSTVALPFSGRL